MSDDKPTLRGCWAKIDRARRHNQRLEELAETFIKRRPNQVFFDPHTDPEWVLVRASIEPMPLEFSLVAGDLVQNLRSSLDHLAWQLVRVDGGTPGRHTAFPIYDSQTDFDRDVRNPSKGRKSPLHGINPTGEIWTQVERVQPYNGGYEDFWRIATFSNRDKHQGLIAAIAYAHKFDPDELLTVSAPADLTFEIETLFTAPDALEHGTPIVRVRRTAGLQVQMKADPPIEITVSDGEVAMGIDGLDKLRGHVVQIIREFERFF